MPPRCSWATLASAIVIVQGIREDSIAPAADLNQVQSTPRLEHVARKNRIPASNVQVNSQTSSQRYEASYPKPKEKPGPAFATPAPPPEPPTPSPTMPPDTGEASLDSCTKVKCPLATDLPWPPSWGNAKLQDIEFIKNDHDVAAAIDCMCSMCGHFEDLQKWVSYPDACFEAAADKAPFVYVETPLYNVDGIEQTCDGTATVWGERGQEIGSVQSLTDCQHLCNADPSCKFIQWQPRRPMCSLYQSCSKTRHCDYSCEKTYEKKQARTTYERALLGNKKYEEALKYTCDGTGTDWGSRGKEYSNVHSLNECEDYCNHDPMCKFIQWQGQRPMCHTYQSCFNFRTCDHACERTFQKMQATIDYDQDHIVVGEVSVCYDDPHFRDAFGYSCSRWQGFLCDESLTHWGYSFQGVQDIQDNCRASCGLCRDHECMDDESFIDEKGYSCSAWLHDDCDNAVKLWGYTEGGKELVKAKCRRTCKYCYSNEDFNCYENSAFLDEHGHPCESWFGSSCTLATEEFDYTDKGEDDLLQNCRLSCNLCLAAQYAVHDIVANDQIMEDKFANENQISRCTDNMEFVDSQGYSCSEWRNYECDLAYEAFEYSFADEMNIIINCRDSCLHVCRTLKAQEPFYLMDVKHQGHSCTSNSHEILDRRECKQAAYELGFMMASEKILDQTGPSNCYLKEDRVYFNLHFKREGNPGRAICWKALPKFQLKDNQGRCMAANEQGTEVEMAFCGPLERHHGYQGHFWRYFPESRMIYSFLTGFAKCLTLRRQTFIADDLVETNSVTQPSGVDRAINRLDHYGSDERPLPIGLDKDTPGSCPFAVVLEPCRQHKDQYQFWTYIDGIWTNDNTGLKLARTPGDNTTLAACRRGDSFTPARVSAEQWFTYHWDAEVTLDNDRLKESRFRVANDYFSHQASITQSDAHQAGIPDVVFLAVDLEGDGVLSSEELSIAWAFVHADLDGSGDISIKEALKSGMTWEVFDDVDQDHDGSITAREFARGLHKGYEESKLKTKKETRYAAPPPLVKLNSTAKSTEDDQPSYAEMTSPRVAIPPIRKATGS